MKNLLGQNRTACTIYIGYIYANVINDTKSAEAEYESFLKKFPDHELSPSVKFELEYLGKSIEEIPALKHITS